jgi:glucokinase
MATVLAVDLGGTKTAIALVDENGGLHDCRRMAASPSLEETVARIADASPGASTAGVIVPGIYDPRSERAWCPNLWGTDEVPLRRVLASRLAIPAIIDSDRTGYVLGESWLGAARGLRDVVFVSIGTGVGIGILSNGEVIRGAHGIAGAAGWWALSAESTDEYQRNSCWESESAGPGLARHAGAVDAQAVIAAASAGNPEARAALDRAALFTGLGVANLVSLLNPEMVVLGGGVVQGAGDLFLAAARSEVARRAQPIAARRCRIELTQLGPNAGLLGAARLAFLNT